MYADDIMLVAASIKNLQCLITIAEKCFLEINLKFNLNKCCALRIRSRCHVACADLKLNNGAIPWQCEIKYLGVILCQSAYCKVNLHSNKVKFFRAFNGILAKLGSVKNVDTIINLMASNCLSILLFNLESLVLSKSEISSVAFPIHRAYMKIFNVKDKVSVDWCQFYMHQLPVEYLLDVRKFKYLKKLSKCECYVMQHLYRQTAECQLKTLCFKYSLPASVTYSKFVSTLWVKFESELC